MVGLWASYFVIPSGIFYDHFGPSTTCMAGCIVGLLGFLGMAASLDGSLSVQVAEPYLQWSLMFACVAFAHNWYDVVAFVTTVQNYDCSRGIAVGLNKAGISLGASCFVAVFYLLEHEPDPRNQLPVPPETDDSAKLQKTFLWTLTWFMPIAGLICSTMIRIIPEDPRHGIHVGGTHKSNRMLMVATWLVVTLSCLLCVPSVLQAVHNCHDDPTWIGTADIHDDQKWDFVCADYGRYGANSQFELCDARGATKHCPFSCERCRAPKDFLSGKLNTYRSVAILVNILAFLLVPFFGSRQDKAAADRNDLLDGHLGHDVLDALEGEDERLLQRKDKSGNTDAHGKARNRWLLGRHLKLPPKGQIATGVERVVGTVSGGLGALARLPSLTVSTTSKLFTRRVEGEQGADYKPEVRGFIPNVKNFFGWGPGMVKGEKAPDSYEEWTEEQKREWDEQQAKKKAEEEARRKAEEERRKAEAERLRLEAEAKEQEAREAEAFRQARLRAQQLQEAHEALERAREEAVERRKQALEYQKKKAAEKEHFYGPYADISWIDMMKFFDFWLFFLCFFVGSGASLLLVTNLENVTTTLGVHEFFPILHCMAFANIFGCLFFGWLSDAVHAFISRPWFVFIELTLMGISQFWLAYAADEANLYLPCSLSAFAFGAFITTVPTVVSELFGLTQLASNYSLMMLAPLGAGLSGNYLFDYVFQHNGGVFGFTAVDSCVVPPCQNEPFWKTAEGDGCGLFANGGCGVEASQNCRVTCHTCPDSPGDACIRPTFFIAGWLCVGAQVVFILHYFVMMCIIKMQKRARTPDVEDPNTAAAPLDGEGIPSWVVIYSR